VTSVLKRLAFSIVFLRAFLTALKRRFQTTEKDLKRQETVKGRFNVISLERFKVNVTKPDTTTSHDQRSKNRQCIVFFTLLFKVGAINGGGYDGNSLFCFCGVYLPVKCKSNSTRLSALKLHSGHW